MNNDIHLIFQIIKYINLFHCIIIYLFFSGLKVNRLDMYGEKYKPFKGIKYMTKAGKFQVRT
jgi:hypothetical protein